MLMIPETAQRITRTEDNFIRTFTGKKFWPLDPRPEDVCIEDIAHALSLQCRFTGHTYCHYSVADHSLRVSLLVEETFMGAIREVVGGRRALAVQPDVRNVALWGLLHDAAEAYLQDMPRPLKHAPGFGQLYRAYEDLVTQAIIVRFGLLANEPAIIKEADNILLGTEKRDLMISCSPEKDTLPDRIYPLNPQQAETQFLLRFQRLGGQ